jgi:phage terminase small subunit|tara:strand:+ start:180 stop:875 length:696 start_codon:yes stop_codon:yes gene_type:complete
MAFKHLGGPRAATKNDTKRTERNLAKVVERDSNGHIIRPVLLLRHLEVVDNYFENGCKNKSKALRSAGYSEPTARSNGQSVFARPDVMAEIAWRKEQIDKRWEATRERIVEELSTVAFANFGKLLTIQDDGSAFVDLTQLDERTRGAIAEFVTDEYVEGTREDGVTVKKYRIKLHDKLKALDMLMRHLGMYNDKVTVEGHISVVERLQAGRARLHNSSTIEGQAEEVEDAA